MQHREREDRRRHEDWLPRSIREAGVTRNLKPGEYLFRMDSRTVGLFEVVSGRIKLVRPEPSGRETILYTAGTGEIVAEASLFATAYHCDAVATTESVVRLYPKSALLAAFDANPQAARAFMGKLAHEIMNLRTRLEQRNIHTARDRVRHYLRLHAGPDGSTMTLTGTLKDLAGELGLAHEALYRTLAEMDEDGEIERLKGAIRLNLAYDRDHTDAKAGGVKFHNPPKRGR
jgi:CRP/FNR family transcriptional regulator, dissimilatory nitrate respiration regulator